MSALSAALILVGATIAVAQTSTPGNSPPAPAVPAASLPAAPSAAPSKPTSSPFTLPRSYPATIASPTGAAPTTPDQPEVCFLPATGIYAPQPELPAKVSGEVQAYYKIVLQRVSSSWFQDMPRAAKDPWYSRAVVTVRFAILPDGTVDPPRVTAGSGRESYDHHALEAIRRAGPFDPLPPDDQQPLLLCVKFGYHANENDFVPKRDPLPYPNATPASHSRPSSS